MQDYYNNKTHSLLKQIQSKLHVDKHHSAPRQIQSQNSSQQNMSNLVLSKYLDTEPSSSIDHIRNRLKAMSNRNKTVAADKLIQSKNEQIYQRKIQKLQRQKKNLEQKVKELQNAQNERGSTQLQIKLKLQSQQILYLNRCNKIQQDEIQKLRRVINNLEKREFNSADERLEPRPLYSTPSKKTIMRLKDISAESVRLPTEESGSSYTNASSITRKKPVQQNKNKQGYIYLKRTNCL